MTLTTQPHLLYIIPSSEDSENKELTLRRKRAMEQAGYRVVLLRPVGHFSTFLRILSVGRHCQFVCIRIDQSGALFKYTLVKLFFPKKPIVWELQGFQEEQYAHTTLRVWFAVVTLRTKRFLLSMLTDGYLTPSNEFAKFACATLCKKPSVILPAYPSSYNRAHTTSKTFSKWWTSAYINRGKFTVMVLGNPHNMWFASDIVERVAKWMYRRDPTIHFFVIGEHPVRPLTWYKNITLINALPLHIFRMLIQRCDVAVALYHKPPWCPLSVPLSTADVAAMHNIAIIASPPVSKQMTTPVGKMKYAFSGYPRALGYLLLSLKRNPQRIHPVDAQTYITATARVYKTFFNRLLYRHE